MTPTNWEFTDIDPRDWTFHMEEVFHCDDDYEDEPLTIGNLLVLSLVMFFSAFLMVSSIFTLVSYLL